MSLKKYEGLISRMCKELARLYITKEDALAVAGRAMLDTREIHFTDKSIDTWKNIIIYSIESQQLLPLIETCQKEHDTSSVLLEAINQFYQNEVEAELTISETPDEIELLRQLLEYLDASLIGFKAQIYNRNELYNRVHKRLQVTEAIPYEVFFATYYDQMNAYEKRLHKVIRTYTEYIRLNNDHASQIVKQLKFLDKKISKFSQLRRHLDFWLHKYETLFLHDPAMCLVYTGVGEKIPFPKDIEASIRDYIDQSDQRKIK